MSSAVDIQIVSTPNLQKIENFFKNASYRETIEFSANFNTRLCLERRLRLPFFDPQTRIAQNHSQLFMDKRLRMPGFKQGQIYTYPAARWRKSRRQYLNRVYRFPDRPFQGFRKEQESLAAAQLAATPFSSTGAAAITANATMSTDTNEFNSALLEESSSLGAGGGDTSDSKDSQQQQQQATQKPSQPKDDLTKEWFYDDMDMNDVDSLEDPKSPADDEYDYDPRYGNKKRRKRRAAGGGGAGGKRSTLNSGDGMLGGVGGSGGSGGSGGRRRSGAGRGRNSLNTSLANLTAVSADAVDGGASNSATSLTGIADVNSTPTTSGASGGRRQRGTGTRGRRRSKKGDSGNSCDPPSPGLASEPPSFESAAAAVGVSGELGMPDNDLRNYRKYLL